jgi:hypothetical protein
MQSHESVGARAAFALDIPLLSISYILLALIALAPRVLSLGSFVTVDEIAFWIPRSDAFLHAIQAGDFPATAISSHPGVTTMWLGSAGVLLRRALLAAGLLHDDSFTTVLAFYRLPVALAHTVGILAGYALLRRMLPALVAALAALLWAADPFVIAYSRVLHVDGLAGTFITLSLLAACLYWFHDRRRRFLILSAICAGLAILSKSPALVLLPVVGLIALAARGRADDGQWTMDDGAAKSSIVYRLSSIMRSLSIWAGLVLLTAIVLWPALWAGPLRAIDQVRFGVVAEGAEPHMQGNFFLGREDDAPGLLFYPLALALRLTPWTLLGLLMLPIAWRRMREIAPTRRDLALLALYVIVFVAAMSLFPKKFNRYVEPVFPALDVLAAVGIVGVGSWELGVGWLFRRRSSIVGRRSSVSSTFTGQKSPWAKQAGRSAKRAACSAIASSNASQAAASSSERQRSSCCWARRARSAGRAQLSLRPAPPVSTNASRGSSAPIARATSTAPSIVPIRLAAVSPGRYSRTAKGGSASALAASRDGARSPIAASRSGSTRAKCSLLAASARLLIR